MDKKRKFLWYTVGIGCLILFAMILVSSILTVGEKLAKIHKYVEIGFYVLSALLVYFIIINPIRIIVFSPSFDIVTTVEKPKRKNKNVLKKVAKNILKNNDLSEADRELLINYKSANELKVNLQMVFNNSVKKELNGIIIRNAKVVMISTAISQNARVDMLTTASVNLKMIKELVMKCGFRPSMKNLSKLTLNVLSTALIAEGLESINLEDILPNSTMSTLGEIPLIKPVMASVTQGIANALLTIRIGTVTRKYLFKDGAEITKEDIRRSAWKESLKILPIIINDTLTFFPKKIINLFRKKKDTKVQIPEKV